MTKPVDKADVEAYARVAIVSVCSIKRGGRPFITTRTSERVSTERDDS